MPATRSAQRAQLPQRQNVPHTTCAALRTRGPSAPPDRPHAHTPSRMGHRSIHRHRRCRPERSNGTRRRQHPHRPRRADPRCGHAARRRHQPPPHRVRTQPAHVGGARRSRRRPHPQRMHHSTPRRQPAPPTRRRLEHRRLPPRTAGHRVRRDLRVVPRRRMAQRLGPTPANGSATTQASPTSPAPKHNDAPTRRRADAPTP